MEKPPSVKKRFSTADIVVTGLFAALVFAASRISFDIPTPLNSTRLHLGNVLCLLSGLVLGPLRGGLSAGIGSAFFDLTDPRYTPSLPFTLVFKFIMAFVCGMIAKIGRAKMGSAQKSVWDTVGAVTGAVSYVALYLSKNWMEAVYVKLVQPDAAWIDLATKAPVSLINGAVAVVCAVPLAAALRRALRDMPLYKRITGR